MVAGLETFAKVRALHDRATIPGEKASAAAQMKTLARKAGMSVEEAVSKLDAPEPKPASRGFIDDLFNSPAFKARDAERQRERAERRAAAVARYGTEDAVFADTEREAALRQACAPLTIWDKRPGWQDSYTLLGWGGLGSKDSMPPAVREAVTNGWPRPETVAAAWAEFEAAEALDSDRYAFEPDYTPHRWVEARRYVVEDLLDTLPAKSLNDLRARMSWLEYLSGLQCQWTHDNDAVRFATLRADIERMGERIREQDDEAVQSGHDGTEHRLKTQPASPVQTGHQHRTRSDRRQAVVALMNGGLADREIARRVGVSPTTVGAIRKNLNRKTSTPAAS